MDIISRTPAKTFSLFVWLFACMSAAVYPDKSQAEFALDFTPEIAFPSQRQSVANVGCKDGLSTVNGHNRSEFSCGDGFYFMQEIVSDGTNQYYHVIVGDPIQDAFAQEFFIRTAGCCWFTAKGPANNPMFGAAPLSASWGDTGKLLSSALFPLAPVTLSGNGSGNPSRIYMKQINQDTEMYLEFNKAFETKKPTIIQVTQDANFKSDFKLDNSNAGYSEMIAAKEFKNTLTVYDNGKEFSVGGFDAANNAQKPVVTGGMYTYLEGPTMDGSFGMYFYEEAEYDPVYINWLSYCDPAENSFRGCVAGPGPGGSGPGGPGANLRAGQEDWWAAQGVN